MKKRHLTILFATILIGTLSAAVCASEATESMTEAASSVSENFPETLLLSDKWSDYQIQIDDQVYQFPMMYADLEKYGWTTEEDTTLMLEPNQYDTFTFQKDDIKCYFYILNLGMNNMPVTDCIVGGIDIDTFSWDTSISTVTLPGGIVRGKADVESIKSSYGTPSDIYEGDYYTSLTYDTDSYSEVKLEVDKESGTLTDITVRNFTEPENFNAGEVNAKVPAKVSAYQKPAKLSDSFDDFQIELDGQIYTLPVPVSVLAADGWEIDETQSDPYIKANYYGWVTLRKGGQEIRETVTNQADYATIPSNCWIDELTVGGYSLEAEGALPLGIHTGMPESEMLSILDGAGIAYEADTSSSSFKYYSINKKEYDQLYQVTVYTSDDGSFEKDSVMEISCSNAF